MNAKYVFMLDIVLNRVYSVMLIHWNNRNKRSLLMCLVVLASVFYFLL